MEARDIATPAWMTPTFFVLIAIGAALALAIIVWGTLRRRAKAAERKRAEAHRVAADPHPNVAPPSVSPTPLPAEAMVPIAPLVTPEPVPAPPLSEGISVASAPVPAPGDGRPLTDLKGLGPKAAARLAELGVPNVAALAAKSDAELAALDADLGPFAGRIARDRWAEQARLLAAGDIAGFEARFGKLGG